MNLRGVLYLLLSALCFGSYGVWSRLLGSHFDNFFQGWTRSLIIIIILLPILIYTKELKKIKREDYKWVFIFSLATAFTQAPLYYAFNHMDIASAHLIFFVSMMLTMFTIGFIFFSEKLNLTKAISFFFALIGLYLIFSFSISNFAILAASMALLNGVASGSELASSKKITINYSPLYISFISWIAVLVSNLPVSILIEERMHSLEFNLTWFYQFIYSIVSLLGFWLAIKGLKYIESSIGSLILLLEVVFAISFGIILFKEVITLKIIIGTILILLAGGLPYINELITSKKKDSYA